MQKFRRQTLFEHIHPWCNSLEKPFIIGLTGGIASGKSSVAQLFSRLGARIVDADRIGHEILREESVKQQIMEHWGETVFSEGDVNRQALAQIVFDQAGKRESLTKLEEITHPVISRRILDEIEEATNDGFSTIVLDVPLLFENNWDEICDRVVFVDVKDEIRLERALARGWSKENWQTRENEQLSVVEKKRRSSNVVDGSENIEVTFQQVKSLWSEWKLFD